MKQVLKKPIKKLPDVKEDNPDKPELPEDKNKAKGTPPPLFVSSGDEELDKAMIEAMKWADQMLKIK